MWDISVSKNHGTDADSIRPAVKKLVARVKKQYGIEGSWIDSDCFEVSGGKGVNEGEVKITAKRVTIGINLGFAAKLVKSRIRDAIKEELDELCD